MPGQDLNTVGVDPLTRTLPKADFTERLQSMVEDACREGNPLSLLVIDIDHFKSINDAFGHARGDEILREFAGRLLGAARADDVLVRFGGDEFVLILPHVGKRDSLVVARRLLETVRRTPFAGDPPLTLSLSIGLGTIPTDASDGESLFGWADRCVYEAKRLGRGRVVGDVGEGRSLPALQPVARLIERDAQMDAMYGFFHALPSHRQGILTIDGPRGSGRTRFLEETRTAAALLGYEVFSVRGTPALRGRVLGAVLASHPEYEAEVKHGADALAKSLHLRARQSGRRGLVIVVDDADSLDPSSRDLLNQLSESPVFAMAALVRTLTSADLRQRETNAPAMLRTDIDLQPFSVAGLHTWLRTTLQWEPPVEFTAWLHDQSAGLPERVEKAIQRLIELTVLSRGDAGWFLDPQYPQLALGVWLESRAQETRSNIPAVATSIIGRDLEITESKNLLREGRFLTLFGPGGFGKTRLSIQVAAELEEELQHGVCFVQLASIASAESVVPRVLESLRVPLHVGLDPRAQLLAYLRDRRLLLVLDNFEHVVSEAPLVADILESAPDVKVLVTSRESLNLAGESIFPVHGLALPASERRADVERSPAAQLFVQQARRHEPTFSLTEVEAPAVAGICERVGGVPLAIEIAAALIRLFTCEEILAEIKRDPDSLSSVSRDRSERHRSLRAVFDYSWNLLGDQERQVFRRLALFRGGFSREAAEIVAGAPVRSLTLLASKSLLHRTTSGRFEIHNVLRRYAYAKLEEAPAELEQVESSRSRYFAAFIYARGERRKGVAMRLAVEEAAAEIDNVRAGFEWAVRREMLDEVELYLKGLFRFYDVLGWYKQGEELFRSATEQLRDERLLALLLARQGYFASRLGDLETAKALHRRSSTMLRRLGAGDERALSLYNLGLIAFQQGDPEGAEKLYRHCLRLFRRTRSKYGVSLCLNDLGVISLVKGAFTEAAERFEKSLALRREIGDQGGEARSLNNLGIIADSLGKLDEARTHFAESLAVSRAGADRKSIATALMNLGVLIRRIGEERESGVLLGEARQFLQEGLEIYEEIGARDSVALTLYNLGDIALLLDDLGTAEMNFVEAMRRAVDNGSVPLQIDVVIGVAKLLRRIGAEGEAAELLAAIAHHPAAAEEQRSSTGTLLRELETAMAAEPFLAARASGERSDLDDLARRVVDGDILRLARLAATRAKRKAEGESSQAVDPEALIEQGRVAERHAEHARARQCYERALHGLRDMPSLASRVPALLRWIARTHIAEGDFAAAEDSLEASLAAAAVRDDTGSVAHAINLQGIALWQRGELDEAAGRYQEARVLARQVGDDQLTAMVDQNLSVIAMVRGDIFAALEHNRSCLEGFRSMGMEEQAMEALNNLGMLYLQLQEWDDAGAAFEEVIRSCTRSNNVTLRLLAEENLVELWIGKADFEAARSACDSAFDLATKLGNARALAAFHKQYGVIYRETNRLHLAERHFALASQIAEEKQALITAAETAREQAELYWRQHRAQETLQALNRAHRHFSQLRAQRDLAATDRRIKEFEELFLETVRQWGESIETKDSYTQGHCRRVADLACDLARIAGMDERILLWFRMGALLHDVGKIGVPVEILTKPGALAPDERAAIERHPDLGVELLEGIDFPWDILPMVRFHHERWEGGGYPSGIAGEEIPYAARILCIADVYDALTSDRPYRPGFSHAQAIDTMENGMRGHFDPSLFLLFKQLVARAEVTARAAASRSAPHPERRKSKLVAAG
jgi:diguanylate cyclase (GGDEF)-like protein/putative nucleotidyltransferase with HDIG domain